MKQEWHTGVNEAFLFLEQIFRAESVSDPVRCFIFQGRQGEPISQFLNRSLFLRLSREYDILGLSIYCQVWNPVCVTPIVDITCVRSKSSAHTFLIR